MRPLKLVMQSFGPYDKETVIDFAALQKNNFSLFLINGNTGSGKTVIFDAICYALYGELPGSRNPSDMRCRFSDDETPPFVELVFTIGSATYRVYRSPEYKKQGRKTATAAHASLWRIDADGAETVIEEKISPLNKTIIEIIGLDKVQFCQVVLLPQGDFRRFLLANSNTRSELLSKLFDTTSYRRITEKLRANAKTLQAQKDTAEAEMERLLCDVTGGAVLDIGDAVAVQEKISSALEILKEEIKDKQAAIKEAADAETAAKNALTAGQLIEEKFSAYLEAEKEAERQEKRQAGATETRQKCERAEAAKEISAAYENKNAAAVDLKKIARQIAQSSEEKTAADAAFAEAAKIFEAEKSDAAAERRAKARDYLSELKNVEAIADDYGSAVKIFDAAQSKLAELREKQQTLPKISAKTHAASKAAIEKFDVRLKKAEDLFAAANEDYLKKQVGWHSSQAYLLAKQLKDGIPCPVCGSTHHPQPAACASGVVTEDELKAAQEKLDAAMKERETAHDKLNAAKEKALQDEIDAEKELQSGLLKISEEINQATAAAAKTKSDIDGYEKRLPQGCRSRAAWQKLFAAASAALMDLEKSFESAQNDYLEKRDLQAKADAALKAQKEASIACEERLRVATEIFECGLKEQHFADESEFCAALENVSKVKHWRDFIKQYENELFAARENFKKAAVVIENLERPDITALIATEKDCRDKLDALNQSLGSLTRELETREKKAAAYKKCRESWKSINEKFEPLFQIASCAEGNNPKHIPFETYVQRLFLSDIVVYANERLKQMTNGRYELNRTDDKVNKGRGSGKLGLELEIFDAYSGDARPVATLSGGESFLTALSLALGLADAVMNWNGGIRLDTVFIDEGFGTLDAETLDKAIDTLRELNADDNGGRLVGIISHVAALAERIDARLDVKANGDGTSTAKFNFS